MATTKVKDMIGQRFGRLTVIERAENYKQYTLHPDGHRVGYSQARWKCKCDCGKEVTVLGANLRAGRTKSCGCLMKEMLAARKRK